MRSHGYSWDRTTVAKVEARQRQVSLDEFVSLGFVLGVAPPALITPTAWNAEVSVTPNEAPMLGPTVWRWFCGTFPTGAVRYGESLSIAEGEARTRLYDEAGPDYIATAERRLPGLSHLMQTVSGAQSGAGVPEEFFASEEFLPNMLDRVADALEDAHETTGSLVRKVKRMRGQRKGAQP
jgi:hypothetical protein